jgi:uncharacterized repeat protein (TIGR03843 family)
VCFHVQDKLRTVLWSWAGARVAEDAVGELDALRSGLSGAGLGGRLRDLLTGREVAATVRRIDRLLTTGRYPDPSENWPAVPWPPF